MLPHQVQAFFFAMIYHCAQTKITAPSLPNQGGYSLRNNQLARKNKPPAGGLFVKFIIHQSACLGKLAKHFIYALPMPADAVWQCAPA